jgi:hypothetical protein
VRLQVGLLVPDWRLETRLHKLQNHNNMAAKCHETAVTRRPAAAAGLPKAGIPQIWWYKHPWLYQPSLLHIVRYIIRAHIIAQPVAGECVHNQVERTMGLKRKAA